MSRTTALWRTTPPAIFPVCLGFMGLGLGWRNASFFTYVPGYIGLILIGFSALFFLFFLVQYIAKLMARPGVLLEEIKAPPTRTGIAALIMGLMLLPALLLMLRISVPFVWWLGMGLHAAFSVLILKKYSVNPTSERDFASLQYLVFVGLIIAPVAGVSLGHATFVFWLSVATIIPFGVVSVGVIVSLFRGPPPLMLRPSLMIALASVGLFGLMFGQFGYHFWFSVFYWVAMALAVLMLVMARWMCKGGFSPAWGSFTFPVATFINLQAAAISKGYGAFAEYALYVGLALGTPLIFYIVYRFFRSWVTGALAEMSGAARA